MKNTMIWLVAVVVALAGMARAQSIPARPPSHITTNLDVHVSSADYSAIAGTASNVTGSVAYSAIAGYATNAGNAATVTTITGTQIAAAGALTNAAAFATAAQGATANSALQRSGGQMTGSINYDVGGTLFPFMCWDNFKTHGLSHGTLGMASNSQDHPRFNWVVTDPYSTGDPTYTESIAWVSDIPNVSSLLATNGNGSGLTGITASQVGADAAGSAAAVAANLTIVGGVASNAQTAAQVQAAIAPVGLLASNALTAAIASTGTYYAASILSGSATNWTAMVGTNLSLFVVSPLVTNNATTAYVHPSTLTHFSGAHMTDYSSVAYTILGGSDTTFVFTASSGTMTLDRSGAIGSTTWELFWSGDLTHPLTASGYPNLPVTFSGTG